MSQLVSLDQHGVVATVATVDDVDPACGQRSAGTDAVSPSLALVATGPATVRRRGDRGLVSAEWAMAIIAAVAIVGVLVTVVGSGPIKEVLTRLIKTVIEHALTLI